MYAGWQKLIDDAVAFRRELHREPEIAWEEAETAAKIRARLDEAGIQWRVCAKTGTVATLAPGAKGRHVALRGDIDGLPMQEENEFAWASKLPNRMHACGHDGHTSVLLATAIYLKAHEAELPGPVTLLFQPAEEGGHGAKGMLDDGALEGVDVVYGWHNWPAIPYGKAACPDGAVMCANGTFRITVNGKGGHASQPEACRDPVLAAAAITLALQQIVSRRLPPQQPAVVSLTSIEAPSMETIIPSRARMAGSVRAADTNARGEIFTSIREIAEATAAGYGVTAEVETFDRYGATINHASAASAVRAALAEELGDGWQADNVALPLMASEDFSYFLDAVPGAYALIGGGGDADNAPCHSPHYDFNDEILPVAIRVYIRLAGAPLP